MITAIKSEPLRVLLAHYLDARGGKRMPSRQDIDAMRLGPVLPIIWLGDYEAAAGTFRYRLAGEEVNRIWGQSIAGRLLSDFVLPESFEATNGEFLRVIREEVALFSVGPVFRCADRVALGERLALPLSSDGETADGIIGATASDAIVDLAKAAASEHRASFTSIDALESVLERVAGS